MKKHKQTILLIVVVLVCLSYGQNETSEKCPLALTIKPLKKTYKIYEDWQYEVRIKNTSNDTLRIPYKIDGHYFPIMIGLDGQQIKWEYMISIMDNLDEKNTIELSPGCFYGKKCTWAGLEQPGTYTFYIIYHSPKNMGDSLPYYWEGQLESNKVKIVVE